MKTVRALIITLIWTLAGCYLLPAILLHIPAIQTIVGEKVAEVVADKLGTRVRVGRVDVGFFNRLVVDGLRIDDQRHKPMLQATRVAAKVDVLELLQGRVRISSAQLFGLDARLYQATPAAQPNFQFALDSLASKDQSKPSTLDLAIQSLVVRNGNLRYDQLWRPHKSGLQLSHLSLTRLSGHFILHQLTPNRVDADIKKLSFAEQSGLQLDRLSLHLAADKQHAHLERFALRLPHSTLTIPSIAMTYTMDDSRGGFVLQQGEGRLAASHIRLDDLAFVLPQLKACTRTIHIEAKTTTNGQDLNIKQLRLKSDHLLEAHLSGSVSLRHPKSHWLVVAQPLKADLTQLADVLRTLSKGRIALPKPLTQLGLTEWRGKIVGQTGKTTVQGKLTSEPGNVSLNATIKGKEIAGKVETEGLELGQLLGNKDLGRLVATVEGRVRIPETLPQLRLEARANVPIFDFKGYRYHNIALNGRMANDVFDGQLGLDDPNGRIHFEGKVAHLLTLLYKEKPTRVAVDATLTAANASLSKLHLTDALGNGALSFTARAQGAASSWDDFVGTLDIKDFQLRQVGNPFALSRLHAEIDNGVIHRTVRAQTDFARVEMDGRFSYQTLVGSLQNLVGRYLPSLISPDLSANNDHIAFRATVEDTPLLRSILHLPLTLHAPIDLSGTIAGSQGDVHVDAPELTVSGQKIYDAHIDLNATDSLRLKFAARQADEAGDGVAVSGQATALGDHIHPMLTATLRGKLPVLAQADADVALSRERGKLVSRIHLNPSTVDVDTLHFNVLPSDITYGHQRLDIDHFEVSNKDQLISINGQTTGSEDDSLRVSLRNIDVPYILDLVHFKSVRFDGTASGTAYVKQFFTQPTVRAELRVDGFQFEKGDMGTLHANVTVKDGRVNIDAVADDGPDAHTDIKGFVSIKDNYIDLPIEAHNSRLNFVQSFTSSFLDSVKLRGHGWVRVIGPLSDVNLTGDMRASGEAHVTSLNTTYRMRNARVLLQPNEIMFMNDTLRDAEGHYGLLSGGLHHQALRHLTYDIFVDAHNLLAYNNPQPDLKSAFWGLVYATGRCAIHGRPGETTMDIEAAPGPRSFIEYNAAQEGTVSNNSFIEWVTPRADSSLRADQARGQWDAEVIDSIANRADIPSDLRINFLVNTTPDFTLRVLMDAASGDNIALRGNGVIQANWFNKGAFQMFGNYDVEDGSYDLTIQNIIKRSFRFQSGSSIAFGGDPLEATLNLKARYLLNSVPLSDLQLGQSFKRNNIRVNCLMDISGTPDAPSVTFGLDLPTLSADAQQMVRSVINSQEDMNQQVLYLLAVGRFYTQGTNNAMQEQQAQSQTSLAMQSLLSGTLSQQINSVLSNVVKSDNWSFGANISTGNEGFSNAEYEGLLNGRLFNNRLLINGEFGYRDNATTDNASFIGDFDIRYLFTPNGNLAIRFYNQNNDRYFTRNSLNTQGVGLIVKKDFTRLSELFGKPKKKDAQRNEKRPKKAVKHKKTGAK